MQRQNLITRLNHGFAHIGAWSLQHRWWVFAVAVLTVLASVLFSINLRMNNSFDAYFNANDPAYTTYLQYREDFGSDEIAYLLYDAGNYSAGVFDLQLMKKIAALTTRLEEEVPFVKEVKSIANVEVMVPEEDNLEIIKLADEFPQTQEQLTEFAQIFMTKDMYIGGYVSKDRRFGAIRIDMEKSSIDPVDDIRLDPQGGDGLDNLYPQVTQAAIERILAEADYADIKFYISGDVPLNAAYNIRATRDMSLSTVLAVAIVSALLLYFFKFSVIGLLGPLSIVFLSIIVTMGFIGAVGWDMDMLFAIMPTLLIALGIAHSVHIISEFRMYHAKYHDRGKAIRETLSLIGAPCLLTCLTTAAGFMAMSVSPIKTIAHFSTYTGIAVIAAFFFSITVLSFFLSFGKERDIDKIERKNAHPRLHSLLTSIAHFNIRYPQAILLAAAIIFALAGAGIYKVKIDSNFLLDFRDTDPIRIETQFIDNTMGGMGSLVYLFDTGVTNGVKNPQVLREIERFQHFVAEQYPVVQKTYSIVDLLKDINQTFHNDDPAYYKIPDSPELIAQYLLVYEIAGGEELFSFISSDYSRANLEIRTQLVNSSEMAVLKARFDAYQAQQPLTHSNNQLSGIGALWIQLVDYISQSQLQGVLLAFAIIAVLMCFIFRSIKVGLLSMIPNVAPSVLAVGLIGWFGIHLDYVKLMIAPIAIGIAVDDTIHMLSRLQYEFNKRGNYNEALIAAMTGVGRALLITSVVLVCGFSAYGVSQMESQLWFGILLSLTIIVALIADFFVMPALILVTRPFGPERHPEASTTRTAVDSNAM